jgi:hypothetical protein
MIATTVRDNIEGMKYTVLNRLIILSSLLINRAKNRETNHKERHTPNVKRQLTLRAWPKSGSLNSSIKFPSPTNCFGLKRSHFVKLIIMALRTG